MHLAVLDTQTKTVEVFAGKKKIIEARFNAFLSRSEMEQMRRSPHEFIASLETEGEENESQPVSQ